MINLNNLTKFLDPQDQKVTSKCVGFNYKITREGCKKFPIEIDVTDP